MSDGDKLLVLVQQIFDDDDFLLPRTSPPSQVSADTPSTVSRKFPKPVRQQDQLQEQKEARNRGKAYRTYTGRTGSPRQIGPPCAPTCRLQCSQRIGQSVRCNIFREFWCIADHTSQWEFIAHHMSVTPRSRVTVDQSRRSFTRTYFFSLNGTIELVCKTMFINTLGITGQWIATVCKKLAIKGYISVDGRGRANVKKRRRRRRMCRPVRKVAEERVMSGEEPVVNGEETMAKGGERVFIGEEGMLEGEELMFEGEELIFEGEELIFEDEDLRLQGEELMLKGKEEEREMTIEFLLDGSLKTEM